jgi:hypothetical protein
VKKKINERTEQDLRSSNCGRMPSVKKKMKKREGKDRLKTTSGIEFCMFNRQEKKE